MTMIKTNRMLFLLVTLVIFSLLLFAGCISSSDEDSTTPVVLNDTTAPTVTLTTPSKGVTGVATNATITATFSETMNASTITGQTFTLTRGGTSVTGTVTYTGVTAVFTASTPLLTGALYSAAITTRAKDMAGNALAVNYNWSFTTGAVADFTAPTVTLTTPLNSATSVAANSSVSASFNEAINPQTISNLTFTLFRGGTNVTGTVTYSGLTAVFTPSSELTSGIVYVATITTGVKDLAGNTLTVNYNWNFTTTTVSDITAPTVALVSPLNLTTNVAASKKPFATFSEAMNPLTISNLNFYLMDGLTSVSGTVSFVGQTASFSPDSLLKANTTYTARIKTGVKDLAGNALANDYSWSFTTPATVSQGPPPVDLGIASDFVILAKTGISNIGNTAIIGDLGVSPTAAASITGFSLSQDSSNQFATSVFVIGKVYASNFATPTPAKLTTAISNVETAFSDAAGRSAPDFTELYSGNISGRTLVPGLYKWSTGVLITNAGVILSGGPNDVWIFQIAQDLIVSDSAIVSLIGGAQAKNVFWQVSGQTTLGTSADFKGNVLCQTLLSMNAGARITGRVLVQTAVTLNAATLTLP